MRTERGFTLPEVILCIAALGAAVGIVFVQTCKKERAQAVKMQQLEQIEKSTKRTFHVPTSDAMPSSFESGWESVDFKVDDTNLYRYEYTVSEDAAR